MLPTNPYVLAAVLVFALGYFTVEKVKEPVKRATHTVCHVVTLGHHCKSVVRP